MGLNVIQLLKNKALFNYTKSNFLGVLLGYSTFNVNFNDTKYEMLAICLMFKQNSSELLGRVII